MLPRRTKAFVLVPTSFQLAAMAKSRPPGFYQFTTSEEMVGNVRHVSTTIVVQPLPGDVGPSEVILLKPGEMGDVLKGAAPRDEA